MQANAPACFAQVDCAWKSEMITHRSRLCKPLHGFALETERGYATRERDPDGSTLESARLDFTMREVSARPTIVQSFNGPMAPKIFSTNFTRAHDGTYQRQSLRGIAKGRVIFAHSPTRS